MEDHEFDFRTSGIDFAGGSPKKMLQLFKETVEVPQSHKDDSWMALAKCAVVFGNETLLADCLSVIDDTKRPRHGADLCRLFHRAVKEKT